MVSIITNPVPKPKHGTVIVDWSPRICGATAWCGHVQSGDPRIELLSFSPSGRKVASWVSAFDWNARKLSDAVSILNDYDRIILGDVVCFSPGVNPDDNGRPYYETIIHKVHRPWTGIFHGGTYPEKHDDTIDAVLTSPGFCGTLLTPRIGQARSRLAKWPALKFEHLPYLPYDVTQASPRPGIHKRSKDVMMTSRLTPNKGQNAALVLADHLRGDTHIWGYNPYGFPSTAWGLWELGLYGFGYKEHQKPVLQPDKMAMTHPNAVRFYTGEYAMKTPTQKIFQYHGAYRTLDEIDWSPWLHLSLASSDFAGILEYTIIDAVMSGSIAIVPECFPIEGVYESIITFPFEGATIGWDNQKQRVRDRKPFDPRPIADVVNGLLRKSNRELGEIQNYQYQEFCKLHSPKKTIAAIDRALKGYEKNHWEYHGAPVHTFTSDRLDSIPGPLSTENQTKYLYRLLISGVTDYDEIVGLWKEHYGHSIQRSAVNRGKQKIRKNGSLTPATSSVVLAPENGESRHLFIERCIVAGMDNDTMLPIIHQNYSASARNAEINHHRKRIRLEGEAGMPKFTTPSTTAAQPPSKPLAARGRPPATPSGIRPSGDINMVPGDGEKSGAFIRRCLTAGMTDDDILATVHGHFEGSKASKSDISWNKQKLRKEGIEPTAAVRIVAQRPEPPVKVQKVAADLPPWEGKTKIEIPKRKVLPQTLLATLNQTIRNLQFLVDNLGE